MKLLLHICCAPCSNMCIETLRGDGIEPVGFWYNPNIHPFTEYRARRNCLREYAKDIDLKLLEQNDYGLRPFVREVAGDIDGRCVDKDVWLDIAVEFDCEAGRAAVYDGERLLFRVRMTGRAPMGIMYLHMQTLAESEDFGGSYIKRMDFEAL